MYNGTNIHRGTPGQQHTTLHPAHRMEGLEGVVAAFRPGRPDHRVLLVLLVPRVRQARLDPTRDLQVLRAAAPEAVDHQVLLGAVPGAADHRARLQEIRRSAQKESQIVDA
ncbi:hypothetical protein GLW04_00515 [Halobacillus litoralis]|uniref:Uncharacterized protein n=1 Tax=Halobacillus litoralis TaxID=45668 RepID=A0A845DN37_9BACI|nr:hypothetical protein [Halobacillus litoralis]MYL18349.1 hypothetical protein [Halobacillus litoralis]